MMKENQLSIENIAFEVIWHLKRSASSFTLPHVAYGSNHTEPFAVAWTYYVFKTLGTYIYVQPSVGDTCPLFPFPW